MNRFDKCVSLLRKYYSGELNGMEEEAFREILKDENLKNIFHAINDGKIVQERMDVYRTFNANEAFTKFYKQQKSKHNRRIGYRIGMSVAVVILLLGIGWILNRHLPGSEITTMAQNELILPGGHRAILHLANGEVVNFDRDSLNVLENNGTRISYIDGKITYQHANKSIELAYNELIVPIAGECYITLDDGTKVWVNADSRLKYPVQFDSIQRKVYLEGEAYFDVVKEERPFRVVTSKGEIAVLGTAFGVSAYTGENEYTTLVRGRVSYTSENQESVCLEPGEQSVLDQAGKLINRKVDVEEYVGWKEGIFVFRDKPLEEIMAMLARWYGADITYGNEAIRQLKYTGNLERYDSINTFLEVLEKLEDIHYEIKNNTIVLYQK